MKRDYNEDLTIDKNALEIEWEKQAAIYFYWAEKEAEALEAKDKASQRLDIVQAEMDAKIRANPSQYGLGEKTTETAIKNILTNSKEYREAENELIEKNKIVRVLNAAVIAFDHKKKKEYIEEAHRLDLEVRLPSLEKSDPIKWKAKDGILYAPFIEIKGVGEKLIEKCIMPEVAQEPKGKGMTGFFQIKEKPKETTNKLKTILDKLTTLEQEGNRSELQKYFSFNI
jgi:hypothetical protein